MAQIDAFFQMLHEQGGSDLHLSSGSQPIMRIHGQLHRIRYRELGSEDLKKLLYEITPEEKIKEFEELRDVDFGYEIPGMARYRANLFQQNRGISASFRQVPEEIKSIEDLQLPDLLKELVMLPKGLILVTGPTGSGKSTTLAAMIDYANTHRREHILTIEDPIEFVHPNKGCLVQQRELGRDTRSFKAALRAALREDPDIILVGEMRDMETIQLALEAAETGHLVLSTLHTISAAKTVDRIIDTFPGDLQAQVRSSLSESLRAVISQVLFKRVDNPGRALAMEMLIAVPAVRNLIREQKTFQLPSVIQTSRSLGMLSLDDEILKLLRKGVISAEDAYHHAIEKSKFTEFIGGDVEPEFGERRMSA